MGRPSHQRSQLTTAQRTVAVAEEVVEEVAVAVEVAAEVPAEEEVAPAVVAAAVVAAVAVEVVAQGHLQLWSDGWGLAPLTISFRTRW